jgi:hypothetical protein
VRLSREVISRGYGARRYTRTLAQLLERARARVGFGHWPPLTLSLTGLFYGCRDVKRHLPRPIGSEREGKESYL